MATPLKPALKTAFGKDSWGFVLAVANIQTPTLTELNATAGFNLSCSVFGEQEGVTGTTEKVTLPRLLCETTTYEVNGSTNFSLADLVVSFDPQAASSADGKKAWTTLVNNASGFLWQRQGVDATADLAAGQFVNVFPVQLGTKVPGKTSTGADGVYSFTQPASITGLPAFSVAVTA